MITEGMITEVQAYEMLGWSGPVPSPAPAAPTPATSRNPLARSLSLGSVQQRVASGAPPICPNANCNVPMILGGTNAYRSYRCDRCRSSGTGERWFCATHRADLCFRCGGGLDRHGLPGAAVSANQQSVHGGRSAAANPIMWHFANTHFQQQRQPVRDRGRSGYIFTYPGGAGAFHSWTCPSVAKSSGKWYYEITLLDLGQMDAAQFGFAIKGKFNPSDTGSGVGDDRYSWGFDGMRKTVWHAGARNNVQFSSEHIWEIGGSIQLFLDLDRKQFRFGMKRGGDGGGAMHTTCIQMRTIRNGDLVMPAITSSGGKFRVRVTNLPADASPLLALMNYKPIGSPVLSVAAAASANLSSLRGESKSGSGDQQQQGGETKGGEGNEGDDDDDINGYEMHNVNPHFDGNDLTTPMPTGLSSTHDEDGHTICSIKDNSSSFFTYSPDDISLRHGSYYYEVEIQCDEMQYKASGLFFIQIGWYDVELFKCASINDGIGDDSVISNSSESFGGASWAVDGERCSYWCAGKGTKFSQTFSWKKGTIVGCYLTLDKDNSSNNSIAFTVNGNAITPAPPAKYRKFNVGAQGLRPGLSMVRGEYDLRLHAPFKYPPGDRFRPVLKTIIGGGRDGPGSYLAMLDPTGNFLKRRGGMSDVRTGWRARLFSLDVVGMNIRDSWKMIVKATDMHYIGRVSKYAAPSRLLLSYSQMILMESVSCLRRCTTAMDKSSRRSGGVSLVSLKKKLQPMLSGDTRLSKSVVDLLLPSVVSRLTLLHERGCSWLSKPVLPLLIHTHASLQKLVHEIGYKELCVQASSKVVNSNEMTNLCYTLSELESSMSTLIVTMSTRMIASVPVSSVESGKASLWLESNLFSGGVTEDYLGEVEQTVGGHAHARSRFMYEYFFPSFAFCFFGFFGFFGFFSTIFLFQEHYLCSESVLTLLLKNDLFSFVLLVFLVLFFKKNRYDVVVEGHAPLGLWLSDPPEGTRHESFVPYVHGFRRVGARREPGLLERTCKVRTGHRLIGVRSTVVGEEENHDVNQFASLEDVYRVLRETPRPMVLTFHTLSKNDDVHYNDVYKSVTSSSSSSSSSTPESRGSRARSSRHDESSADLRTSSAERWKQVQAFAQETGKSVIEDQGRTLERERVAFCRLVALDETSTVVKWLMKAVKLKGKVRFYGQAWSNKGMYKRDIQKKQERALCAALLKHSGLWYYAKYPEHMKLKEQELTMLVNCMSNSFQELRKKMRKNKSKTSPQPPSGGGGGGGGGGGSGEIRRKSSLFSSSGDTEKYGNYMTLIDTLDVNPLYVDANAMLEESEDAIRSEASVRGGVFELPLNLDKYLERCMFMIDVVPVRITPDSDEEIRTLERHRKEGMGGKEEDDENEDENGGGGSGGGGGGGSGRRGPTLSSCSGESMAMGLRTASSVRSIMSDPELGANIGHADAARRMIMYQERFGQCIEYAFEESAMVEPLSLLHVMQKRDRRGYIRSFGQCAMTSLIKHMTPAVEENREHAKGGVLIHQYVRLLLAVRSSYRGITMDEARVKHEAWQSNGKWESHVHGSALGGSGGGGGGGGDTKSSESNGANSSSYLWRQHTERLHHYTASLWSGGRRSMDVVQSSFEY